MSKRTAEKKRNRILNSRKASKTEDKHIGNVNAKVLANKPKLPGNVDANVKRSEVCGNIQSSSTGRALGHLEHRGAPEEREVAEKKESLATEKPIFGRNVPINTLGTLEIEGRNKSLTVSLCDRAGVKYLNIADGPFHIILPDDGFQKAVDCMKSLEAAMAKDSKTESLLSEGTLERRKAEKSHCGLQRPSQSFRLGHCRFHFDILERKQYRGDSSYEFRASEVNRFGRETVVVPISVLRSLRAAAEELIQKFYKVPQELK